MKKERREKRKNKDKEEKKKGNMFQFHYMSELNFQTMKTERKKKRERKGKMFQFYYISTAGCFPPKLMCALLLASLRIGMNAHISLPGSSP